MAEVDIARISHCVRELTEPYRHNQPYIVRGHGLRSHAAHHPSLLDQLRQTWQAAGDDGSSGVPASAPPIPLGALDVLLRIETQSAQRVTDLGAAVRDTIEANVRLVGSRVSQHHALADDIEHWWRWARIESQWDGRPRALRDRCPDCGDRALRVAWDVSCAWCAACAITWGANEVGLLAAVLEQQRADLHSHT